MLTQLKIVHPNFFNPRLLIKAIIPRHICSYGFDERGFVKPKIVSARAHSFTTNQREIDLIHKNELVSSREKQALHLLPKSNKGDEANLGEFLSSEFDQEEQQSLLEEIARPWESLLTRPSRAIWRSTPKPPPTYITSSQFDLIQRVGRTSKQLRRTYKNIVKVHAALAIGRERERRLEANLEKKSSRINEIAKPVFYKPEQTLCNLKYRLIPNYSITTRILSEINGLLGPESFTPKNILDVGIGVGSASAAALDYFKGSNSPERQNGIEWIHGIDPSQSMRDATNVLLNNVLDAHANDDDSDDSKRENRGVMKKKGFLRPRITLGETLTSGLPSITSTNKNKKAKPGSDKSFDLALCFYTLSELPHVESSLSVAALIWERLRTNGIAIFVEPGKDSLTLFVLYS